MSTNPKYSELLNFSVFAPNSRNRLQGDFFYNIYYWSSVKWVLALSNSNILFTVNEKTSTVKSLAVDRSTIQFWNFLTKGHRT